MELATTEEEQDLIQRVQEGDCASFAGLMDLHVRRVRGYVARIAPVDHLIDEIAHETFVFAFRHIHLFSRGGSFYAWLKSIAWQLLRCEAQRTRRERTNRKKYAEQRYRSVRDARGSENEELLERFVLRLRPVDRDLLDLRYRLRLPMEEIGRRVGRSSSWVRVMICRIRRQLQVSVRAAAPVEERA